MAAGRRWFDIQQEMNRKRQEQDAVTQAPARQTAPQPTSPPEDAPWSAWRKQKSALLFYGLQDGSGWLILQHQDGRSILMPWPMASAGWESSMPISRQASFCLSELLEAFTKWAYAYFKAPLLWVASLKRGKATAWSALT